MFFSSIVCMQLKNVAPEEFFMEVVCGRDLLGSTNGLLEQE